LGGPRPPFYAEHEKRPKIKFWKKKIWGGQNFWGPPAPPLAGGHERILKITFSKKKCFQWKRLRKFSKVSLQFQWKRLRDFSKIWDF